MLHIRFVIVIVIVCVLPFPALLLLILFVSVLMLLLPSVLVQDRHQSFRDSLEVALLLQPAMAAAQAAEAKHRGNPNQGDCD